MNTGFSFGAKTTAAPTFGTGTIAFGTPTAGTAQTQPAFGFGTPTSQPATGGIQLGTAAPNLFASQGSTLNFKPGGLGVTPTQSPGLFGATTTATALGTGFGASAVTSAPAATGLTFGAPAVSTGLTFGTPATTVAPNLSFGTSTAAPTLSFGTATTTQSGTLFGSTAVTTAAAPSFGLGFGTSSAASTTGLGGLGGLTTKTTAGGLTFGATPITSAPASTTLNFGLGSTTPTSLSLNTPSTSAPASVGLGGVQTTQTKIVTTQKEIPPKEQPLPNEILQTVDQFKEMVKQQKLHSSDIARCSVRDFRKVEQEIDHLTHLLTDVENQLQKNRHLAEKLKYDTAKCLQNVEMAQRTQDTPPGFQYENMAPLKFFLDLADQFEREMQVLKFQIDSADKYVKNNRSPDALTAQDLALGMRKLHETFVALAGRLQAVHSQVESQKESYLNMRKQTYNDSSNPFENIGKSNDLSLGSLRSTLIYSPPKVAAGPTPFSNLVMANGTQLSIQQNQLAATLYPGSAGQTSQSWFGKTGMSFGNTQIGAQNQNTSLFRDTSGQILFGSPTNFQLQKPPTGNKRGKQ